MDKPKIIHWIECFKELKLTTRIYTVRGFRYKFSAS